MGWNDEWRPDADFTSGNTRRFNNNVYKCISNLSKADIGDYDNTIASGEFTAFYDMGSVFDGDTGTNWISEEEATVTGVVYIGQENVGDYYIGGFDVYGETTKYLTSVKVQSWNGSSWVDEQTISMTGTASVQSYTLTNLIHASKIRFLANSESQNNGGDNAWQLHLIKLYGALSPLDDPTHWQKLTGGFVCNF